MDSGKHVALQGDPETRVAVWDFCCCDEKEPPAMLSCLAELRLQPNRTAPSNKGYRALLSPPRRRLGCERGAPTAS